MDERESRSIWSQPQALALAKTLQGWMTSKRDTAPFPFRLSFEDPNPFSKKTEISRSIHDAATPSIFPTGAIYEQIDLSRRSPNRIPDDKEPQTDDTPIHDAFGKDVNFDERIPAVRIPIGIAHLQCHPVSKFTPSSRSEFSVRSEETIRVRDNAPFDLEFPVSCRASTETFLNWSDITSAVDAPEIGEASISIDVQSDRASDGYASNEQQRHLLSDTDSTSQTSAELIAPEASVLNEIEAAIDSPDSSESYIPSQSPCPKFSLFDRFSDLDERLQNGLTFALTHWRWVSSCACWTILILVVLIVLALGTHDHVTGSSFVLPTSKSDTPNAPIAIEEALATAQTQDADGYHDVDPQQRTMITGQEATVTDAIVIAPVSSVEHERRFVQSVAPEVDDIDVASDTTEESRLDIDLDQSLVSSTQEDSGEVERRVNASESCPASDRRERRLLDGWLLLRDLEVTTAIVGETADGRSLRSNSCYLIEIGIEASNHHNMTLAEVLNPGTSVIRAEFFGERATDRKLSTILHFAQQISYSGLDSTLALKIETESNVALHLISVLDSPFASDLHIHEETFDIVTVEAGLLARDDDRDTDQGDTGAAMPVSSFDRTRVLDGPAVEGALDATASDAAPQDVRRDDIDGYRDSGKISDGEVAYAPASSIVLESDSVDGPSDGHIPQGETASGIQSLSNPTPSPTLSSAEAEIGSVKEPQSETSSTASSDGDNATISVDALVAIASVPVPSPGDVDGGDIDSDRLMTVDSNVTQTSHETLLLDERKSERESVYAEDSLKTPLSFMSLVWAPDVIVQLESDPLDSRTQKAIPPEATPPSPSVATVTMDLGLESASSSSTEAEKEESPAVFAAMSDDSVDDLNPPSTTDSDSPVPLDRIAKSPSPTSWSIDSHPTQSRRPEREDAAACEEAFVQSPEQPIDAGVQTSVRYSEPSTSEGSASTSSPKTPSVTEGEDQLLSFAPIFTEVGIPVETSLAIERPSGDVPAPIDFIDLHSRAQEQREKLLDDVPPSALEAAIFIESATPEDQPSTLPSEDDFDGSLSDDDPEASTDRFPSTDDISAQLPADAQTASPLAPPLTDIQSSTAPDFVMLMTTPHQAKAEFSEVGSMPIKQTRITSTRRSWDESNADFTLHDSSWDWKEWTVGHLLWWVIGIAVFTIAVVTIVLTVKYRSKRRQNVVPQLMTQLPFEDTSTDEESVVPDMDLPTGRSDLDQIPEDEIDQRNQSAAARRDLDSASGRRPLSSKLPPLRGIYFPFKSIYDQCAAKALMDWQPLRYIQSIKSSINCILTRKGKCKIVSET